MGHLLAPATNTFQASTRYSEYSGPQFQGEVSGDRLSFDVDMRSASLFGHRCSAVARLQGGGPVLRGTLSCANNGNTSSSEGYDIKIEILR